MNPSSSNATVADNALELVRELYNNPDIIPAFNEELIRKCANQVTELYNANLRSLLDIRDGTCSEEERSMTMIKARQAGIERIKQCCCAYLNERMNRLKHLRWKTGGLLSDVIKTNLGPNELKWFNSYADSIFTFQNNFGEDGIDLFKHVDPPKSLLIHVRALKDFGEFVTSDGTIVVFAKNSMHYLPKQDCENLIRRGILEQIN
ncbi:putative DNA replication complex GINS protein PSF1 [Ditylenchus destructor]|nr:putative DNA replication complex GINS protein PSF1 [Ditylenchus destructor]